MNRFRKFYGLGRSEMLLFCESLLLHMFIGLLLKVVPFRLIPGIFKSRQFEIPAMPEDQSRYEPVPMKSGVSGRQIEIIKNVKVAVQRAGWVSPWRNRCLVSSLSARCMLRRRKIGSELSLGVGKDANGKFLAHAWLIAGEIELVSKSGDFQSLLVF